MENDIIEILNQQNISITELNDEQISSLSEYCFNIISQFHDTDIDEFSLFFHHVLTDLIHEEQKEDEMLDQMELEIQQSYFKHLDDMEKTLLQNLEEVRELKKTIALEFKVKELMKLPQPEQRSKEWYEMRKGMVTASDIGDIIGISKYGNRNKIILKKCGLGPPFRGNIYTRHGQMFEPIATDVYATRNDTIVYEFGLIQHPTHSFIGASPDGITEKGIMLEIKCPFTRVINGDVMDKKTLGYYAQIQTQLEVCDLEICDFFECKFLEYPGGLQQYLEDIYVPANVDSLNIIPRKQYSLDYIRVPNCRRSANGQEKGIILKYKTHQQTDDEWQYAYPDFLDTTKKQLEWLQNEEQKDYKDTYVVFWKLDLASTCRVHRDRKWWAKYFPSLDTFWKEVLHRRVNGCQDIIPKKRASKSSSKLNAVMDLSKNSNIPPSISRFDGSTIICSSDED